MSINHWWHARNIMTDAYRDGGAPSNDTLVDSVNCLDVGKVAGQATATWFVKA